MKLTDTLSLTEQKNGFWLYDKTRGMNLSMRAKTEQAAFVEALTYYQKRLLFVECECKKLKQDIETVVSILVPTELEE